VGSERLGSVGRVYGDGVVGGSSGGVAVPGVAQGVVLQRAGTKQSPLFACE